VEAVDRAGLTRAHELLLQAVLPQRERAIAAYAEWQALVAFDDLDAEAYRLVPWLYCNVQASGVTDALTARLRGVFRRTWYSNQLVLHSLAETVAALHGVGVETRVVGGGLLILSYRDTPGLYPLDAIDVLMRPGDHEAAFGVVRGVGWTPIKETQDGWILQRGAGYLALHRDIVHGLTSEAGGEANSWIWRRPRAMRVDGQGIALVNPEAHLLFIADYGVKGGALSPLRWLAEIAALLTSGTSIDWNDVLEQARLRHAEPPLAAALQAVGAIVPGALPQGIVDALLTPASAFHRTPGVQSNARAQSLFKAVAQSCGSLWRSHERAAKLDACAPTLRGFARYLAAHWQLSSAWSLPQAIGQRVLRLARRQGKGPNDDAARP